MMLRKLRSFLFGTLRGRLILGVAAVHALMMALFIFDVTERQRAMLLDRQAEDATALAQSLSTSAAGWIKADDISGLQELVEAQRRYPELLFAMLVDEHGRILAHTDQNKNGLYLHDLPGDVRPSVLGRTPALVDAVAPALLGDAQVGWARVGIGQKAAGKKLAEITLLGIMYALAAIGLGSLIAWRLGRLITRRLYAVQETINQVRMGNRTARSSIAGNDEAASIAAEFNAMLDMLAERDSALSRSETKYRALFESANDIVFIHEITGDGMPGPFLEVNELACRRLGYSREELARLSPMEIDDPYYRDRIPAAMERIFKDGYAIFETAHLTKDGRSIPMEISTRVVDFQGTRLLFSIGRDLTERKQAAQRLETEHSLLRAILNSSQDIIIFALDKNYCYTAFNEQHRREMKKVWDADIQIGLNLLECMSIPELRDLAKQSIDRALRGEMFTEVQHQPAPDIYYELIWNPVIQNETIVGATVFIFDITGRKRSEFALRASQEALQKTKAELEQRVDERTAELTKKSGQLLASRQALMNLVDDLGKKSAELEHANTRLKELDQLKSMFIASMSHELRTPLNSIIGFSSIILDEWLGALNEEQKKNLATVLRSGKHLLALINDVIDVSKIEAGKLEISVDDFELSEVLTETAALFSKEMRDKGLEFVLEPLHLRLRTDRRRLSQCLLNLLGNAVKFTEQGAIRMTARLSPAGGSGVRTACDLIEIAVADTGIGIREEDVPKLFGAFVRLPLPKHMNVKGTGLGLYLTGKIAREVLGGDIKVESFCGKGSCFTMLIPTKWQERREDADPDC